MRRREPRLSGEESNGNRAPEPKWRQETRKPGGALLAWMKISRDRNQRKTKTETRGRKRLPLTGARAADLTGGPKTWHTTSCRIEGRNKMEQTLKNDTEPKNSAQENENRFSAMTPRPTKIETKNRSSSRSITNQQNHSDLETCNGESEEHNKMQNMIFSLKSIKLQLIYGGHRPPSLN
jgi:hypothetical protein